MADQKLRAVVLGCQVGRNHADGYVDSDAAELVALCDLDKRQLDLIADQYDVEARYTDFETMLEEQQPDLISIATPQQTHAALTILAATRYTPKGSLCEKGMAVSMGEARAMIEACNRNGVKLIIGHENRYLTQIEQARNLVAAGAIGEVQMSHIRYAEGGMMNIMCHACDRALFIMGDPEPAWVMGNVQRDSDRWERSFPAEERAVGVVGFADGARLILEGETPNGGHTEDHRHTVVGTEGMLTVRYKPILLTAQNPGAVAGDPIGLRVLRTDGRVESFEFPTEEPDDNSGLRAARRREIDTFARWVTGEVEGHYQEARWCVRTQEILMAIYESARTHSLVELPMQTNGSPLIEMIESGALPVRYPGRYDTRHRTAVPPANT